MVAYEKNALLLSSRKQAVLVAKENEILSHSFAQLLSPTKKHTHNMKFRITAILLSLCSIAVVAQTAVTTYLPGISTEGAAYYLPKTAINVNITTEKTTYTPGELCQYADRYLRISNISNKENVVFSITSATISTEGLPDASKLYHILFATNSVAPLVTLTESGILQAINNTDIPETPVADVVPVAPAQNGKVLSARSYMTEEMLMTGSKAKLAELAAKEIYAIRESKNLIMRGQSEYMAKDAESLQIILSGLQEQEEALTQLFTGTTTVETATKTYQVIPEGDADRVILGRFSRKLGLLHGDDLAGAPIYIDIRNKQVVPVPMEQPVAKATKTKIGKKAKDENKQDGLVYNLPGKAAVKVYTNTQTLAEEVLTLAQLGKTETLSSTLLTKKKDIKVVLDPITGALLRVE